MYQERNWIKLSNLFILGIELSTYKQAFKKSKIAMKKFKFVLLASEECQIFKILGIQDFLVKVDIETLDKFCLLTSAPESLKCQPSFGANPP